MKGRIVVLIKAGLFIDGTGKKPSGNMYFQVEAGKITAVGQADDFACQDRDEMIDLSAYTVLPGLIDAHVHLFLEGIWDLKVRTARWREDRDTTLIRAVKNVEQTLRRGVTTVRDLGGPHAINATLKKAVNNKTLPGPRIITSNKAISITGGHFYYAGGREADGPEEMTKAVREQLKGGANVIKIMMTGCVDFRKQSAGGVQLTMAETEALVTAASSAGKLIATHANGCEGVRQALRCGVNTLEHGALLDEETAILVAQSQIYWVPTLVPFKKMLDYSKKHITPTLPQAGLENVYYNHLEIVRKAWRSGAKLVAGTDAGALGVEHGNVWQEMALLREAGMSGCDVICAATGRAAAAIGLSEVVGTLQAGKWADFIVVEGDPTVDVSCLKNVKHVYKAGIGQYH